MRRIRQQGGNDSRNGPCDMPERLVRKGDSVNPTRHARALEPLRFDQVCRPPRKEVEHHTVCEVSLPPSLPPAPPPRPPARMLEEGGISPLVSFVPPAVGTEKGPKNPERFPARPEGTTRVPEQFFWGNLLDFARREGETKRQSPISSGKRSLPTNRGRKARGEEERERGSRMGRPESKAGRD